MFNEKAYMKKYNELYKEKNKEKIKTQNKAYCHKHKNEIRIRCKNYRNTHHEQLNDYYQKPEIKKRKRINSIRFKKTERGRKIAINYSKKRHTKLRTIIDLFPKRLWDAKVKVCNGICPICKHKFVMRKGNIHKLTKDHTPPLSKVHFGYMYSIEQVTPMCVSCNSSKKDKFLEEI